MLTDIPLSARHPASCADTCRTPVSAHTRTPTHAQAESAGNLIPANTRVESFIAINRDTASCDLVLKTNNESIIRGVVVFGEQIFPEESLFMYPKVCLPAHTQDACWWMAHVPALFDTAWCSSWVLTFASRWVATTVWERRSRVAPACRPMHPPRRRPTRSWRCHYGR
jgi:hypothetical protein